ncbi:hypothetical protein MHK01_09390 [Staphylococcus auricularis]|uniref:hypothetical protein n=1 Tax=Staphylococcus auricularis TaxID=29379 RepID=UPI001EF2A9C9|nr:hypothetical protein [Staphylococcus auricularis]MCG7342215.1 hypothetical protein [Staphylococcus auricularis]
MGYIKDPENQCNLCDSQGRITFVVYPLGYDSNVLISKSGWRYTSKTSLRMSDEELMRFKKNRDLYYEEELNKQMELFDD